MSNELTAGVGDTAPAWWDTDDLNLQIIESIQQGDFEMAELEKIHVCNVAVERIPVKKLLHYMWEDNDLEGLYDAERFAAFLQEHAPGRFVVIDTGDYIIPPCSQPESNGGDYRHNCEVYDAAYHLYLVPASVWESCKDEVMAADKKWREESQLCQQRKR